MGGGRRKPERGELRCDGLGGVERGTHGTAGISACLCRASRCVHITLQSPWELKGHGPTGTRGPRDLGGGG